MAANKIQIIGASVELLFKGKVNAYECEANGRVSCENGGNHTSQLETFYQLFLAARMHF